MENVLESPLLRTMKIKQLENLPYLRSIISRGFNFGYYPTQIGNINFFREFVHWSREFNLIGIFHFSRQLGEISNGYFHDDYREFDNESVGEFSLHQIKSQTFEHGNVEIPVDD